MAKIQDTRVPPHPEYNLTLQGVTAAQIQVTMLTVEGYNTVCTGLAGRGNGLLTDDAGNTYHVNLPGAATPHSLNVTFKRTV